MSAAGKQSRSAIRRSPDHSEDSAGRRWSTLPFARLIDGALTPRRAIRAIVGFTLIATLAGGLLIHLVDRSEYPTIGSGLWWSAQTVTTVGYGDSVPSETAGRIVAVYVMLTGVAFLTVATAAVTATLMDGRRGRRHDRPDADLAVVLAQLDDRMASIEQAIAPCPAHDGRGTWVDHIESGANRDQGETGR